MKSTLTLSSPFFPPYGREDEENAREAHPETNDVVSMVSLVDTEA